MTDEKTAKHATALDRARERAEKAAAAVAEARKRADQAKRKLAQIEARKAAPRRAADTQRKILLGAALLGSPELLAQIVAGMAPAHRARYDAATARAAGE